MDFSLTKKDILALNQEFEESRFHNESSLDFAISYSKNADNWIKSLAFLTRAILIDHVFEEGNKRTVALLIKTYAEYRKHKVYDDKILKLIKNIILKNTTSIRRIEDMIKDAIK